MMYSLTDLPYQGEIVPSVFSTRNQALHASYKRTLSSAYAMTSVVKLEKLIDGCTDTFISKMLGKLHTSVDLGEWFQWFAYDVVGEITFLKRFGFMEEGRDINDLISAQNFGEYIMAPVSQVPEFHKVLLGNPLVIWISTLSATIRKKNPALYITEVCMLPKVYGKGITTEQKIAGLKFMIQFVESQIKTCDEDNHRSDHRDLLSYLRAAKTKDQEPLPEKEVVNHLTNNVYVFTTVCLFIWLEVTNPQFRRK